ncbi:hypothetical protein FOL46_003010, partial [Perkinsus olseni]
QQTVSPEQDPDKWSRGRIRAKNQQTQALTKSEPQRRALHYKQSQETPQRRKLYGKQQREAPQTPVTQRQLPEAKQEAETPQHNAERQQQAEQSVAQRITDVSRKTGVGRISANVTAPNRLLNDLIKKYEEGATAHRMLSMTVAYMLGGQLEPAEAFNYLGVLFKIAADNDWAVAQKYDHTVRSQWSAGSATDKNFVPDVGKLDLEALWTARR